MMMSDWHIIIMKIIGQRKLYLVIIILVHYKYILMNDNTERNTNQFE